MVFFLIVFISVFACDKTCLLNCNKETQDMTCIEECGCENIPKLREIKVEGETFFVPELYPSEILWAESQLGCDINSLEFCMQTTEQGEQTLKCLKLAGCSDLIIKPSTDKIVNLSSQTNCKNFCSDFCAKLEGTAKNCLVECTQKFCMMTNLKAEKEVKESKVNWREQVWAGIIFVIILVCFYKSAEKYLNNKKYFPQIERNEYRIIEE